MNKTRKLSALSIATLLLMSVILGFVAYAQPPVVPMTVYGTVMIDTVPLPETAPPGMNVYAKEGATIIDQTLTTATGQYALSLEGPDEGTSIDLWVEEENLETITLSYMAVLEQDLLYTGVAPDPDNVAPVANAGADVSGEVGVEVDFDGSASYDIDGTIVSWEWDFNDGGTWVLGATTPHEFAAAGTYIVILTVTDNDGATDTDTTTATITEVDAPPDDDDDDDIVVPPATPDFSIDYITPGDVQYDDTLVIIGSGVTAGTTVNAYWDYASGIYANLLNSTVGKPSGRFEVEIDVPSDYAGDHWLWVVDVSTGETISSDAITMIPRIKLSPSSGLAEDEVTIKGYGFTDEANFTSLTFGAYAITTTPEDIETDENGFFEYTFDVPEDATYNDYTVTATDFYGESASKKFTLGASITLDPEEGPTGTKVEVEGRGYTDDATISFTMDGKTVHVVEDDVVTVKSDGTFSAEIVIPGMDDVDEYEITATESLGLKGPGKEDFDVLGIQEIEVDPTYGSPGATITVTGANFTQIAGTEVTVMIGAQILVTAETESDGTFEDTFISPAIEFTTYDVVATDEDYDIVADDAFKVGLIVLIINPTSGEAGTKLSLTGIGFAEGDYNVTFTSSDSTLTELSEEHGTISSAEALSDTFYVPNFEPGTYYLTVSDTDENELTVHFTVTAISKVVFDPAVAPNDYNVSIEGINFADVKDGDVEFIIYNSTHEWDMDVYTTDPLKHTAVTDDDGNFTAWWEVLPDDELSIGDYTVNVTGSEGLFVQVPFSVVVARVSVAPRKAEFDRGDRIQFDINNDFKLRDSYIMIYDPYDTLYWETEPFEDAWWLRVEGLYTVPYYRQTAAENPMELQSDAPMGAWLYIFYDEDDDQLMNGTFSVGPSGAAQVDEKLTELWESIEGLTDGLAGINDDVEDDIAGLSEEIAGVASDLENLAEDIVSDLAEDIADAVQAGEAAQDAVDDLAKTMTDLGDAMTDMADVASDTSDAVQSAVDAANDAVNAANEAKDSASGLTGLVYGAIGASLIAALAAIISLMQISKKIAG